VAVKQKRAAGILCAVAVLASSGGLFVSAQTQQPVGTWAPAGAISDGRTGAVAVPMKDGTTLIAGGVANGSPTNSVLLYDPATNALLTAGQLLSARVGHTATALEDGHVLVIGGRVDDSPSGDIELFDPASGGSTLLGQLAQPRSGHAAARLEDGSVVVFGGANADGAVLDTVEHINVSTGIVSAGPNRMVAARASASATTLIDGRVLIAGGTSGSADLRSAELYIPWSQAFEPTHNELSVARSGHTAVLLPHNGGVLIAGGNSNGETQSTADLFLPAESPDPFSYGINTFVATGALGGARVGALGGPVREGYVWVDGGGVGDAETYRFATIKTDKNDYAPGETAVITGSGWMPGEEVRLLFQEYPAVHVDYELTVTADAAGDIYWDQWAPEHHDIGVRFYLLASDSRSRAQITFTDGNLSSQFVNFQILPASVTPGGTLNWSVTVRCVDGGGPNTCSSEGFTHNGPVQDGYSFDVQQSSAANFSSFVVVGSATTSGGTASGTFAAPSTSGTYFYRLRHGNQNLPNVPVTGNDPNSWQPETSGSLSVMVLGDVTAPTTTLTVGTPKFGTNDRFVTGDTPLTLSCADNAGGTGCAATFYQIVAAAGPCPSNTNEALWNAYAAPFTLPSPDGEVRVCYFSKDTAGNREAPKSQNHVRDTAAPETTVTATANALAYSSGTWTRFNVSVNLSAADVAGGADVKEITYAATGAQTIPSTTVPGASATGILFTTEGTTTLTFFAKDNVGNLESTKTFTIKIDKTAPTIEDLGPTTSPNGAGWYNANVTNRFRASDPLSGLDASCLAAFPDVAGERIQSKTTTGEGQTVTVMSDSCADEAGNTAAAIASDDFKIDKTKPVIVDLGPTTQPNANGWYNTNVTNRFKATDELSGLDSACLAVFVAVGTDRIQSKDTTGEGLAVRVMSASCADVAGNVADPINSGPFQIDKTAPLIVDLGPTANPNSFGWYNTDVTNRFKVTELLSGVDTTCAAAFPEVNGERIQGKTTTGQGVGITVTSDGCVDLAGNAAAVVTSAAFNIDKTAPVVTITSPVSGNTIVLSVAVNGTATDNLSGIQSVTLNGVAAVYNSVTGTWATSSNVNLTCGANTLTAVATDKADLSSSVSVTVTRLCFTFEYLRPLEQSYLGGPTVVNDGKYGRVIPVKGIVRRSGTVQTDADLSGLGLTLRIGVNAVPCSGGAATDAVEEYADAGQSGGGTNIFRWTLDGFWIYNLDTKTPPGVAMYINNCYRLDAYVQDAALNKVKISESPYAIFKPVK